MKGTEDWYPYKEDVFDFRTPVIDAREWIGKPAGKHGWLRSQGEKFVFEDGTPITFWGTNLTETNVHPQQELRRAFVHRLATYGMNAVRFHKFTWPTTGVVVSDGPSTELDQEKMDRMDRLFHELKEEGIYVTWSHIFGHMVSEHDALESGFVGMDLFFGEHNSYGLVNLAEDIQDLIIRLTVRLLDHSNPYTGLRYADDPALAMIELQNEDNIFFFGEGKARAYPHYSKLLDAMFNDWLRRRYGTAEAWLASWGETALDEVESLRPEVGVRFRLKGEPLHPGQAGFRPERRQRLLDSALFLHETQNRYYTRYTEAIRAAGYKGILIGSPWFTEEGIPHYYNLLSDAMVGAVDRHEYWGGGEGHELKTGKFAHESMLQAPGSGLLKRSFDRVAGKPFLMSEWNATAPNEWITEGPFLIAAYGIGLQGWGGSFSYAMDHFGSIYSTNIPPHMAQYPILARMIYRGDIEEAQWVKLLRVDTGTFSSEPALPEVPRMEWMAAGKTGVLFAGGVTEPDDSPEAAGEAEALWDREAQTVRASSGQLSWDYGKRAVTLDTPGTQGFVGFCGGETLDFSDMTVDELSTPFANLLLGSLDRGPIRSADRLLLSAVARSRLTGMRYSEDGRELAVAGQEPLLLEPVAARITLKREFDDGLTVNILDQQGCRTGRTVSVDRNETGAAFKIGPADRAFWYEIIIGGE